MRHFGKRPIGIFDECGSRCRTVQNPQISLLVILRTCYQLIFFCNTVKRLYRTIAVIIVFDEFPMTEFVKTISATSKDMVIV